MQRFRSDFCKLLLSVTDESERDRIANFLLLQERKRSFADSIFFHHSFAPVWRSAGA